MVKFALTAFLLHGFCFMVEDLWYKNAVIYSLDLETFADADGDAIGDFEGLAVRLDYLHALGERFGKLP